MTVRVVITDYSGFVSPPAVVVPQPQQTSRRASLSGQPCDSSVSSGGLRLGVRCPRREGQRPVLVHVAVD